MIQNCSLYNHSQYPSQYIHLNLGGARSGKQRIGRNGLSKRRGCGTQHQRQERAKHSNNVVVPISDSAHKGDPHNVHLLLRGTLAANELLFHKSKITQ